MVLKQNGFIIVLTDVLKETKVNLDQTKLKKNVFLDWKKYLVFSVNHFCHYVTFIVSI